MWIVHVTKPTKPLTVVWDYRDGFFPRRVRYLTQARQLMDEAQRKGGEDISCEKEKKVYPNNPVNQT